MRSYIVDYKTVVESFTEIKAENVGDAISQFKEYYAKNSRKVVEEYPGPGEVQLIKISIKED